MDIYDAVTLDYSWEGLAVIAVCDMMNLDEFCYFGGTRMFLAHFLVIYNRLGGTHLQGRVVQMYPSLTHVYTCGKCSFVSGVLLMSVKYRRLG